MGLIHNLDGERSQAGGRARNQHRAPHILDVLQEQPGEVPVCGAERGGAIGAGGERHAPCDPRPPCVSGTA